MLNNIENLLEVVFWVCIAVLVGIVVRQMIYLFRSFPGCTKCPKCGGWLDGDKWKYKGVVYWKCRSCAATFETLVEQKK